MAQQMPVLDCRKLPALTTRDLSFWLREFEETHGGDPEAVVMRPEQHDAIDNDWTTDTAVPVTGPELFIREEFTDAYSRVGHFRSIPIELRP